jgi:hypothetical protein
MRLPWSGLRPVDISDFLSEIASPPNKARHMKNCLFLLAVFAAGSLAAQPENKPQHNISDTRTIITVPHDAGRLLELRPTPSNEIQSRRVSYSGVTVQVMKVKNPLHLINPLEPLEYGSGDAKLDRDINTGKPTVFKFLSFKI